MNTPARQTIANDVIDRVVGHINSRVTPTQFELKSLERDANKLAPIDAESAALARAGIAAITWDIPRMHVLRDEARAGKA